MRCALSGAICSRFPALTSIIMLLALSMATAAETGAAKKPSAETVRGQTPLSGMHIGVDAGNGAEAPLKITNYKKIDLWMRDAEAGVNRQVERALTTELQRMGAQVVSLTNSSSAVTPRERLSKAVPMGLDLILCIHHSYSQFAADNMTVAYYYPGESTTAEVTARRVNDALSVALGLPKTGAIAAPNLLNQANGEDSAPAATPIVLVICSLMSNAEEFIQNMEPEYTAHQGQAVAQGVLTAVKESAGVLEKSELPSRMLGAPTWRKRPVKAATPPPASQPTPGNYIDGPLARVAVPPAETPVVAPPMEESESALGPLSPEEMAKLPQLTIDEAAEAGATLNVTSGGQGEAVLEGDWSSELKALASGKSAPAPPIQPQPIPTTSPAPSVTPTPSPVPTESPTPSETPVPEPSPTVPPSPTPLPLDDELLQGPSELPADAATPDLPMEGQEMNAAPLASGVQVEAPTAFKAVFPRPVKAPIEQSWLFGEVLDLATGLKRGVSFAAPAGTPVHAIAEGEVVEANLGNSPAGVLPYPRSVLIKHKNPIGNKTVYSMYGQMAEVMVAEGEKVTAGLVIGKTGAPFDLERNDRSTEFEFEIWVGEPTGDQARNPELFLQPFKTTTGLIVGQLVDAQGQPVPGEKIMGVKKESNLYSFTLTYDRAVKPTQWNENFAIGDVPAGHYTLTFGAGPTQKVMVEPGKVTSVTVVAK